MSVTSSLEEAPMLQDFVQAHVATSGLGMPIWNKRRRLVIIFLFCNAQNKYAVI